MAYESLGAGIASAGDGIATGLRGRQERIRQEKEQAFKERIFEENKRQFDVGEANKTKASNMKAGADFLDRLEGIYKEGGDPEGLNQMAQVAINAINTGEPLNFADLTSDQLAALATLDDVGPEEDEAHEVKAKVLKLVPAEPKKPDGAA